MQISLTWNTSRLEFARSDPSTDLVPKLKNLLPCAAVRRPAGKGPLKLSKPKAKGGGLGVKKMTTKVDDSLFDQAPVEAVIAPPPPVAMVSS